MSESVVYAGGAWQALPTRPQVATVKREPDGESLAQVLPCQLASARTVESVVVVNRVCRHVTARTRAPVGIQTELNDIADGAGRRPHQRPRRLVHLDSDETAWYSPFFDRCFFDRWFFDRFSPPGSGSSWLRP
ncbi:hypothetical protein QF032_001025 [Streptomyces achromogenes]|uniref:Uncharacterized protein n=1 Tax=Streptomyces achromogenes TaxID=67255 RepID=A0ABU0PVN5_STRAH|nr:hypothetical protein [Streptomyces achromogenes]MDQ0682031.1 hypothetical protein [Streptomyces achromogenes]MDQ0829181.1 hypothetical protein [Streptomyces achromogenes]